MNPVADSAPTSLIISIADMARSDRPMVGPFVAELARKPLCDGSALALRLTWIGQWLSEKGRTIERVFQGAM